MNLALQRLKDTSAQNISHLLSNIMSDFANSVGTSSLGMYNTLGDTLTSKVSKFINEIEILNEKRTSRAGGERVLVVINWVTLRVGDG